MTYSLQSGIASALITMGTVTHCADVDFLSHFPISIPSTVSSTKLCPFQGTEFILEIGTAYQAKVSYSEVFNQTQTILGKRLTGLGPASIALVPISPNQFLVQLPKKIDPRQALDRLITRSHLTFHLQHPPSSQTDALLAQQAQLQTKLRSNPSDPRQLKQQLAQIKQELFGPAVLTEENVVDVSSQEAYPNPTTMDILLRFDAQGAKQFQEITKKVAGTQRSIGIFLDDQLLSAPIVSSQFADKGIPGGQVVITGNFDQEAASTFVSQMKAGSLPTPIKILSTEAVQTKQCKPAKQAPIDSKNSEVKKNLVADQS